MVSSYEMWGGPSFQFYGDASVPIPLSHGEEATPIQEKRGSPLLFIFVFCMNVSPSVETHKAVPQGLRAL